MPQRTEVRSWLGAARSGEVDLGFRGEAADLCYRYRHGYPGPVIDALTDALGLDDFTEHVHVAILVGTLG
jgi:hypothetical protein